VENNLTAWNAWRTAGRLYSNGTEANMYTKIIFYTQQYMCVYLLLPLLYSPTYAIDKQIVGHPTFLQMFLHVQFMAALHVYKVLNSMKYFTFYFY